jgi:HlyD family secretion protein
VKNETGKLLPGMTATVDFLVGTATDVLKIPNAALRFRPPESLLSELQERRRADFEARRAERAATGETGGPGPAPDSSGAARNGRRGGVGASGRPGGAGGLGDFSGGRGNFNPDDFAVLYTLDDQGRLSAVRARKGLTDGQYTEVLGPNVEEGMQVIAAVTTGTSAASGTAANPLQPGGAGGRDGPGGPPRGPRF